LLAVPRAAGRSRPGGSIASASWPSRQRLTSWRRGNKVCGTTAGSKARTLWSNYRYSLGREELFSGFAAEFVRLKTDVIVAVTDVAVQAAREATGTIPIVMAAGTDPVAAGFVASLARPGGALPACRCSLMN